MSTDRPVETGEGMMATDTGTVPVAGGSARAEFDRRSARHHERARRRRPSLIAAALTSVVVAAVAFATNVSPLLGWFGLAVLIGSLARMVTTPNAAIESALSPELAALGIRASAADARLRAASPSPERVA